MDAIIAQLEEFAATWQEQGTLMASPGVTDPGGTSGCCASGTRDRVPTQQQDEAQQVSGMPLDQFMRFATASGAVQ